MSRSRIVFFVIIGAALLAVVAYNLIRPQLNALSVSQSATATAAYAQENITEIELNYGTEKENWLTEAIKRFSVENPSIKVKLTGQGSMSSYRALSEVATAGSSRNFKLPALWSPAANLQVNLLNGETQIASQRDYAVNCKRLVLSPVVIIGWEQRANAFAAFFKDKGGVTFDNLYEALNNPDLAGQWEKLGGDKNWGLLKLGHTDPDQSNSGLMALVAFGNNYYKTTKALTTSDISGTDFIQHLTVLESALPSQLQTSTGLFVNDVLIKGPSSYDFIIAYEALAIENFANAFGKQAQGWKIYYPAYNLYSDHPICLIDDPSITPRQREAAEKLQTFLLSPEMQALALQYGFRPADPSIAVFGSPGSKFDATDLKAAGLSPTIGQEITTPDGSTLQQLLTVWRRATR